MYKLVSEKMQGKSKK